MKNVLNTTKKKVAAGVTAFMIIGAGAAFAGSDAGALLKTWYDNAFNHTVDEAADTVLEYGEDQANEAHDEYNDLKDTTNRRVDNAATAHTVVGQKDIHKAKDGHIDAIEGEKDQILASMEGQFDGLLEQGTEALNQITRQAKKQSEADLTNSVNGATDVAIERVNNELDQATDDAVRELEEAIRNAKRQITAELNHQSEATVNEAKSLIDSSVNDVLTTAENLAEDLLVHSRFQISKAADAKVDAAESRLDKIVSGIDGK